MLNSIKELINQKREFLEAAQSIFEDATNSDLDDRIILGESGDDDLEEPDNDHDDDKDDKKDKGDDDDDLDDHDSENDGGDVDLPVEHEDNDGGDLLDSPLEGDDVSSVDTQSGEPVTDPIDDILSIQLNLATNTVSDVLPVPPGNAGEAIGGNDDLLTQKVDSGFDNDPSREPIMEDDLLTEGITLGDEPAADATPTDASAAPATAEAEPESEVTTAVKDKVAEADQPVDDVGAEETNGGGAKDELLKKLGSITKSLEDAKRAVMNSVQ